MKIITKTSHLQKLVDCMLLQQRTYSCCMKWF